MRITLLTVGTRGDVEPFLALGAALRRSGHQVCLGTSREFRGRVEACGLRFAEIGINPSELLGDHRGQRWISGGRGMMGDMMRLRHVVYPLLERYARDALAACEDADALLYTPLTKGDYIARLLDIPGIVVALWPVSRTSAFPALGFPQLPVLGGPYNRATHKMLEQLSWRPFQRQANRVRRSLDLEPFPRGTPLGRMHREGCPVVYGFSEAVVPRPRDWPQSVSVTGYWFGDVPNGYQPPDELARFLDAGEPPVVITFGSMTAWNPRELGNTALETLRRTGRRGVLVGAMEFDEEELEATHDAGVEMVHVPEVPYSWLFPRVAAVAHHGGAGTTAAAMRAGVPSVVVPFFGDQPFWAHRACDLGAGPQPVRRQRLSAERLAVRVEKAVATPAIRNQAARVGASLRSEDGLARAVAEIESYLAPTSSTSRVSVR